MNNSQAFRSGCSGALKRQLAPISLSLARVSLLTWYDALSRKKRIFLKFSLCCYLSMLVRLSINSENVALVVLACETSRATKFVLVTAAIHEKETMFLSRGKPRIVPFLTQLQLKWVYGEMENSSTKTIQNPKYERAVSACDACSLWVFAVAEIFLIDLCPTLRHLYSQRYLINSLSSSMQGGLSFGQALVSAESIFLHVSLLATLYFIKS